MVRWLALIGLMLGCTPTVSRARDAYISEVVYINRLLRVSSPAVRGVVLQDCTCANDTWHAQPSGGLTDAQCYTYADWWMVYTAQWGWHHDMMLYNAGVITTRPSQTPPTIPQVSCTLPPVPTE